ncbi:helix-turn-helix domain-containing protein [Bradyrhizobium sp. AUGA SZCCT0158]|uniref:helix-turn-helix domain-containing protein n=1 Tax=Bradyrhizobium sp. AUGA SZCCT0158 TaxID=2807661 RepID=UPI001BA79140|nr:helix-turn-helix domain-containing protein [Bradyrhizobium sp. AUGA SZCCT0158]MBR1200033.1 helix-turn-helix domain-containing protein [Bradyrhizobium sp. AUGA SZCCT0158]
MSAVSDPEVPIPFEQQSFAPKRIAEILDCAESTVFELIATGKLKTFKLGRARRATGKAINELRGVSS